MDSAQQEERLATTRQSQANVQKRSQDLEDKHDIVTLDKVQAVLDYAVCLALRPINLTH